MCSPYGNVIDAAVPTETEGAVSKLLRHSKTQSALICDQVTKVNLWPHCLELAGPLHVPARNE